MGGGRGAVRRHGPWVFAVGVAGVVAIAFLWWRDVIIEGHQGDHTPVVQLHLRYGMILFIASEVMFFVAWFWAYFDVALFPKTCTISEHQRSRRQGVAQRAARRPVAAGSGRGYGRDGPGHRGADAGHLQAHVRSVGHAAGQHAHPAAVGLTVTWAHHALLKNDRRGLVLGLICTVVLGVHLHVLPGLRVLHAAFSYAGHIYGSTFFMATGFHGAHVIIGTIFLLVCLIRALRGDFTPKQHFGFEAAAWYWHFVDVVWLFLFASIYVWGAGRRPGRRRRPLGRPDWRGSQGS